MLKPITLNSPVCNKPVINNCVGKEPNDSAFSNRLVTERDGKQLLKESSGSILCEFNNLPGYLKNGYIQLSLLLKMEDEGKSLADIKNFIQLKKEQFKEEFYSKYYSVHSNL